MPNRQAFDEVLKQAMKDFEENGYQSADQLAAWRERLERAARESMTPESVMEEKLREAYEQVYRRQVEQKLVLRRHPGLSTFTLDRVKPELRGELTKRIRASADLIKLDRRNVIDKTMQRFTGWASSVPITGTKPDKDERAKIVSGMGNLSFQERRVLIDQSHKLTSAINNVVAVGGGAIAAIWHSHYKESGYNFREDHKELALVSQKVPFLIRGSWADEQGLVKLAGSKYTDQIVDPGQDIFCRCYYVYQYALSQLPREMLTRKGEERLAEARRKMGKV